MPDKLYYDGKCFSRKNLSVSFFKEPLSHVPLCLSAQPSISPFALLTWTSLTMLSYMSLKLGEYFGHWIQQPIQQLQNPNFHEFFWLIRTSFVANFPQSKNTWPLIHNWAFHVKQNGLLFWQLKFRRISSTSLTGIPTEKVEIQQIYLLWLNSVL